MRILLTGGAGFIGSHLGERLLKSGHQLTVLDNFNHFYDPALKERNLQCVREAGTFRLVRDDILSGAALRELFADSEFEAVIHLAAWAGVRPSLEKPGLYSEVNVTGTVNLLELSRLYGVSHFVFGSSSSVYGANSRVPFQEDDPACFPISPYAATKRAGELAAYVHHLNYGMHISCLRFFTVYGPRQRPEMAIHKFTRRIDQGEEIPVYHEGQSKRDYTYVDDIVGGTLAALQRPAGFQIYNLGNSRTTPLLDLIRIIEKALGKTARLRLLPAQPGDVPLTYADISKARRELGYVPATSVEEGIPRFVRWYLGENN